MEGEWSFHFELVGLVIFNGGVAFVDFLLCTRFGRSENFLEMVLKIGVGSKNKIFLIVWILLLTLP